MNYKLSLSKIFVCACYTEAGSLYIPGSFIPGSYVLSPIFVLMSTLYIMELL